MLREAGTRSRSTCCWRSACQVRRQMSSSHSQFPRADPAQDFFGLGFDPISDPVAYPHLDPTELEEVALFGERCTIAENDPLVSAGGLSVQQLSNFFRNGASRRHFHRPTRGVRSLRCGTLHGLHRSFHTPTFDHLGRSRNPCRGGATFAETASEFVHQKTTIG